MSSENASDKQVLEVKIVDDGRKNVDHVSRVIAIIGLVIAIIGCFFAGATYYRTFVAENIVISDFETDNYYIYKNGHAFLPIEITFTNRSAKAVPINSLEITATTKIWSIKDWASSQELVTADESPVIPINIEANSSYRGSYYLKFTLLPDSENTAAQLYKDGQHIKIIDFMGASLFKYYVYNIKAVTGSNKELQMNYEKEYNVTDFIANLEMRYTGE